MSPDLADMNHKGRPLVLVLVYRCWSEIMSHTLRPGFTHWKLYSVGRGISQQNLTSQPGIKYLLTSIIVQCRDSKSLTTAGELCNLGFVHSTCACTLVHLSVFEYFLSPN